MQTTMVQSCKQGDVALIRYISHSEHSRVNVIIYSGNIIVVNTQDLIDSRQSILCNQIEDFITIYAFNV